MIFQLRFRRSIRFLSGRWRRQQSGAAFAFKLDNDPVYVCSFRRSHDNLPTDFVQVREAHVTGLVEDYGCVHCGVRCRP